MRYRFEIKMFIFVISRNKNNDDFFLKSYLFLVNYSNGKNCV